MNPPLFATADARARMVLGALDFGTSQNRDLSFALLDCFVEEGGRIVDSAHVYGDWDADAPRSASERMIGAWIRSRGAGDAIHATTKIGHPSLDDPGTPRLDATALRTDVEEARENLGLDTIPLVYLHRDDERIPVTELVSILETFVAEGLIGAYGASNWTAPRLRESRRAAAARGWTGFVVDQPGWGLARQRFETSGAGTTAMEEALYAFHVETGMIVSPYSSQSRGYFARWTRGAQDPIVQLFDGARNRAIAARLDALAAECGVPATELSVAVLLASPFPTFPVMGPGSVDRLRSSFRAATAELPPDIVHRILGENAPF